MTLTDCDHRTPAAAPVGYPYVAIPQLKGGRLALKEARRISHEDFADWTRKAKPQPHDVVLSRRCNPGETAVVGNDAEFALGQNLVLLRADGTRVLPEFLRWLVVGPRWWEQVSKFLNVGAVFDSLRCADVPSFRLPIPPVEQQRAIARTLGTLDDKIDLNRRMNETLEAMARALFKSWFVDFDPVRAKAEGRQPAGMDADTAKLFPSEFVASEMGPIPKGWSVAAIADLCDVRGGSTPDTQEPAYWTHGKHCWVTPKDLAGLSTPVLLGGERKITDAGLARISSGLLPAGAVLMSSRAPIGYLAIAEVPVAINQGFIAMLPAPGIPNLFLLRWAASAQEAIVSRANGSTFLEISKSNFRPLPVVRPTVEILGAFECLSRPWYDLLVRLHTATETLAAIRDSLLPELLAGRAT